MIVRFYCDIYGPLPVRGLGVCLAASSNPDHTPGPGTTRVAFDVEFPDSVVCEADQIVGAQYKGVSHAN